MNNENLTYLNTYVLQQDMRIRLPKSILENLELEQGKSRLKIYLDKQNLSLVIKKEPTYKQLNLNEYILKDTIKQKENNKSIKFIDLFAGIGGLRLGFEQAFKENGYKTECVFTSEIKPSAIKALEENFPNTIINGDISKIPSTEIPDFDFLLAGFPCQSFSYAGKQLGFLDTRGTLFFEVERIIKDKKPYGFLLENVEGLISHDKINKSDKIGRTLKTILDSLTTLGYKVEWKLLECQKFGIPQARKRVFIVGTKDNYINMDNFIEKKSILSDILEKHKPTINSHFTNCLLNHYKSTELYGKSIKDKRGGKNNIHSWEIGLKGNITNEQKILIELLFKERRKKHWANEVGIDWMDGMPLTLEQISKFYSNENLKEMLNDLVKKGYLVMEYPKKLIKKTLPNGTNYNCREQDSSKQIGYNIVAGKLSFEFTKILDSNDIAPTLVATDISHIGVVDGEGIRKLSIREGLRLFGYPETYNLSIFENSPSGLYKAFDLLGNTVAVPVVKAISERICKNYNSLKT